jgi:hypothetical protein
MTAYAKISTPNQHSYYCFRRDWLRACLLRLQSRWIASSKSVVHEGFRGGREETAAKRAQLSFETAMFLSKERIYEQYLCAIISTEYCGPDARGRGSPQQSRIEHIIYSRVGVSDLHPPDAANSTTRETVYRITIII